MRQKLFFVYALRPAAVLYPLLFSFEGHAFAQNYKPLNGPYGGEVYDIIVSGSTLIASVPVQGIVLSSDGGTTWSESNTGVTDFYIRDLEKDPASGKIFALANSRLFSCFDDGPAWIWSKGKEIHTRKLIIK